jgi:6-phosphogluconolactonase
MSKIEVFPDADAVAEHAAGMLIDFANQSIQNHGFFSLALSGGKTPQILFQKLAEKQMSWEKVHLFWVDERCVPPDHPDSNYDLTARVLLNHIDISWQNIHRIPGELPSERAAALYELELHRFFGEQMPVFDLILLGLGTDGHTASLFPGDPGLEEKKRWVIGVKHEVPPLPLVDRVTLTFPILEAARTIEFLVSGREKSSILQSIVTGNSNPNEIPAIRLINNKETSWLVDQEAALNISGVSGRKFFHSSAME